MKHLRIAGLCLLSIFAMGMVWAGNATALSWLVCAAGTGTTEYSTNQCSEELSGGGFVLSEIKATEAVKGLFFTLTLKDTGTALGTSEVQCWGARSTGWVGPASKALILSASVEKPETLCKGLKVCESAKVKKVEGVDLPWKTVLEEGTENITKTKIEGTGGGAGWKVECSVPIVGTETDECTTKSGEPEEADLYNEVPSVLGVFAQARKSSCTLGNATSGELAGSGTLESAAEKAIQAGPTPVFKITGSPKFGPLEAGKTKKEKFTFENNYVIDYEKIVIKAVMNNGFTVVAGSEKNCSGLVKRKNKCELEIEFAPAAKVKYTSTFEILYELANVENRRLSTKLEGEGT